MTHPITRPPVVSVSPTSNTGKMTNKATSHPHTLILFKSNFFIILTFLKLLVCQIFNPREVTAVLQVVRVTLVVVRLPLELINDTLSPTVVLSSDGILFFKCRFINRIDYYRACLFSSEGYSLSRNENISFSILQYPIAEG